MYLFQKMWSWIMFLHSKWITLHWRMYQSRLWKLLRCRHSRWARWRVQFWWRWVWGIWDFEGQKQPPEVFYKKRCSPKFHKIHRNTCAKKHLCQSLLFNKVAGLRPTTLLKKRLWRRCFPVSFVKFLRTPFLQNTSGRLLLEGLK